MVAAWRLIALIGTLLWGMSVPRRWRTHLPVWLRPWIATARDDEAAGADFARACERAGPAAIKLGQILSTRSDLFGADVCRGLSRLKDQLPAMPEPQAHALLRVVWGALGDGVAVGPAVAAASVAQVHRATLADGRPVAVKLLRPGIEAAVARDITALRLAARGVHALIPAARRLDAPAFVAVVADSLHRELDLRLEAASADEMRQVLADRPDVCVPAVYWALSSRTVLVMDWVDGQPLTAAVPADQGPALAVRVMQTFLHSTLHHGVFHADPHEGNLILCPDGRLAYVDFGIVGRLGENERLWLAEMLYGFLRRDYQAVAQAHFDAGYVDAHHDVGAFAAALRAVGEPIWGQPASAISMGRVLEHLFVITAHFGMRLRPELVLLQKTMVTAEGVARGLDAHFDMWATAKPVVTPFIRAQMAPWAQLQRTLRRIQTGIADWAGVPARLTALERALTRPRRTWWPLWLLAGAMAGALITGVLS